MPDAAGCSCSHCGNHDHAGGGDHDEDAFAWGRRLAAPAVLFAAGMLAEGWLTRRYGPAPLYAVMAASYLLCGVPVLREAFRAVRRGDFFNEFTLMSLATIAAAAIGEISEAVGVMLFYSMGEAVQDKAAGTSRRSIEALLASRPEKARLMVDGRVEEVPPESIPIGSRVLVKPGDRIPLDGVALSGSANIDMSSLTGESLPVAVETGGKVFSGAICLDGDLVVRTTAVAADSMAGKILAMVEHAVAMKSRTERFITTFARHYTPAVAALAALVALLPPLAFGAPWSEWTYRGLVVLVVSCPCALFLSVPLAYFAGIGAASRHGILVKGGHVFDALGRAGAIIFDKTGTLTEGRLSLSGVETVPGVSGDDALRLAALAESRSNHPVARAIEAAAAAAGAGEALEEGASIRDVAGKGVVMTAARGEILVGNAKLLRDNGVEFVETPGSDMAAYVALNRTYQGCLLFSDAVKRDSAEAVARLRSEGFAGRLYMLTGDREESASAVAGALGLDGFRAGLLPDGKVGAFGELSPDGRAVFVGDGVNDAPVLAAAGVGVAMGALGSAAAVEAADAVILDDSPARLPVLFRIASRTRRIAGGNIVFALVVKAAVMALGVWGISGLWAAVFADVGVALLAVLNSMRLTRE